MPESLFPAVCALAIFCSAKVIATSPENAGSFAWAAVASLSLLLLYAIIPRWGLAAVLSVIPLVYALRGKSRTKTRKIVLFCTPFAAFALAVVLPDRQLRLKERPHGDYFLQMHLFCVQAQIMKNEVDQELAAAEPRYPKELLRELSRDISNETARYAAPGHDLGTTPSLGFDADKLMYGNDCLLSHVSKAMEGDPRRIRAFFMYFYVRAWLHQPGAMSRKITEQMLRPFRAPELFFDVTGFTFSTNDELSGTRSVMVKEVANAHSRGAWTSLESLTSAGERSPRVLTTPEFVVTLHRRMAQLFLPLLALVSVLALWGAISRRGEERRSSWLPWSVLSLCAYAGLLLNCLTVGIIHTLDQSRYLHNQALLGVFAVCSGAVSLLLFAFDRRPLFEQRSGSESRTYPSQSRHG